MPAAPPPPAPPGFEHVHSGKVRDLYKAPDGALILVASDRISAFDFVLESPIPDKGRILTAMSLWWFDQLRPIVGNHLWDGAGAPLPAIWAGRATRCVRLDMLPVEAVARGYLAGSGLVDYRATGAICGIALPPGLVDGDRLPEPIFTPATKAALGEHDENVSYEVVVDTVGSEVAERLRALTLAVYARAEVIARDRGIVLADTKLEFGRRPDGTIVLADEVLTPDSSRFWDADAWERGVLDSYDKQYVRNWLLHDSCWDRHGDEPPPALPEDVVAATRERYLQAYERLTGTAFTT
jgi:phosphoribosylaminoimidazole-succinocarboxamide synthase